MFKTALLILLLCGLFAVPAAAQETYESEFITFEYPDDWVLSEEAGGITLSGDGVTIDIATPEIMATEGGNFNDGVEYAAGQIAGLATIAVVIGGGEMNIPDLEPYEPIDGAVQLTMEIGEQTIWYIVAPLNEDGAVVSLAIETDDPEQTEEAVIVLLESIEYTPA